MNPFKWVSLTAASAVLMAGCAAGPQRAPEPTNPNTGNNVSTTTGDADACAVALGNTVTPGRASIMPYQAGVAGDAVGAGETTANGLIIGNIALVALPAADNLPTSPGATPGTTGAAAPGGTTVGAPGTTTTAPGIVPGTKNAPAPVTGAAAPPSPIVTGPVPAGSPGARGVPGGTLDNRFDAPVPGAPETITARDGDAVERIKTACDKLADIRVVNNDADKVRLGQITQAMREGQPITDFMTDLTRMVQGATSAGGGRNATRGPTTGAPAPATTTAPATFPTTLPVTPGVP